MTIVSNRDGVIGAEERCGAKSGHGFVRIFSKGRKFEDENREALSLMRARRIQDGDRCVNPLRSAAAMRLPIETKCGFRCCPP